MLFLVFSLFICILVKIEDMIEIWKDIDDYNGIYQVSNLGRIKSLCNNKTRKEKILKLKKSKDGYLYAILNKNNKRKNFSVHRLVAQAFIPNPENKPCIDHINTDRSNNRVENLRWVTPKENMNNPLTKEKISKNNAKTMKDKFGNKHNNSKPVLQFTKDGEFIRKWGCAMDVERELEIKSKLISRCCRGKKKTTYGYKWHFHYKGIWLKKHIPLKDKKVA